MVRFVSFEGGDGAGKSTQILALQRYLTGRGRSCLVTREPGGTTTGELIRNLLLKGGPQEIVSSAELFLYLADRAQHVNEIILPALHAGQIVLCDRFTDSTLAYQGYGRGIDLELLGTFNGFAVGGVKPDLTMLLDCPVNIGLARTRGRLNLDEQQDRFEGETVAFHERIRAGFLSMAAAEPERFRIIDSSRPQGEVAREILGIADREILYGIR